MAILIRLPARSAFLRKLNNDVGPHERFAIEMLNSIFGVLNFQADTDILSSQKSPTHFVVFEFDKSKAGHYTTVNDSTISVEEF
jgi:hypothetical protein